jgi:uncharacterized membrane protein YsdA (DUF1294 family)
MGRSTFQPRYWVPLGLLVVVPVLALVRLAQTVDWRFLAGYASIVSIATFAVYGWDKRRAEKGEWRVPEARLHLMELAGGWAAAYLAQRYFRHKIAKTRYLTVYWSIVAAYELLTVDYLLGWPIANAIRRLAQ